MSEQQKYWFAARTRDKQEFAIRDSLEKLKTELDLNYYLPTQFVIRQLKYRRKRVEVPVIKNLIFIQATKQDACDISNKYNIQLFYMKDLLTRAMLIVPDKQMQDFIFVMDLDPNGVSFDNDHLSVGSRVQVVKGDFCGVEGELAERDGLPTVKYFADKLCLSSNYFGDMFKKETGKSPQEYIQEKVIELAKERISGTADTVSQIAYSSVSNIRSTSVAIQETGRVHAK